MGPSAPVCVLGGFNLCAHCLTNTIFWRTNRYEIQKWYYGVKEDSWLRKEGERANTDSVELPARAAGEMLQAQCQALG